MLLSAPQIQLALKSLLIPKVVSVITIGLIAWWSVEIILPMFDKNKPVAPPVTNETKSKPPVKQSLNKLNLFGETINKTASNKTSDAKPTKLNLTLRGILATDDPKQGIAQIQNEKKEERHFAVDDKVFGIATLVEIYRDRVILLHNGRYETLLLPEEFLNVKHFSVEQNKAARKKVATDYLNIFLNGDGIEILKLFGFDTAYRNGGFFGFVIKALGPKGIEMMDILGVKDGDVIVVVNGLRFSETLEAAQQLKELKDDTSVDIIIDRNGEEIPFHFEFDSPIADKIDFGEAEKAKIKESRPDLSPELIDDEDFDEEDLEPDWADTPEGIEYKEQQRLRRTGVPTEVEMDH